MSHPVSDVAQTRPKCLMLRLAPGLLGDTGDLMDTYEGMQADAPVIVEVNADTRVATGE